MPGVTETLVYDGPEGRVFRQQGLGLDQFHARRAGTKGRYYGTRHGAIAWLRKQAEKGKRP